jgi:hypothetical protein
VRALGRAASTEHAGTRGGGNGALRARDADWLWGQRSRRPPSGHGPHPALARGGGCSRGAYDGPLLAPRGAPAHGSPRCAATDRHQRQPAQPERPRHLHDGDPGAHERRGRCARGSRMGTSAAAPRRTVQLGLLRPCGSHSGSAGSRAAAPARRHPELGRQGTAGGRRRSRSVRELRRGGRRPLRSGRHVLACLSGARVSCTALLRALQRALRHPRSTGWTGSRRLRA